MKKITMFLLAIFFISGCECRDQHKQVCGDDGLCLTIAERTTSMVVFVWTSAKPVESTSLMCGVRSEKDPYRSSGVLQTTSGGGTSGRISLTLAPDMVYNCDVHVISPWRIKSNIVRVEAVPY